MYSVVDDVSLVDLAQQGNEQAKEELVKKYRPLVVSIARNLRSAAKSLPLEDLISEGFLGLLKAVDRFDSARGVWFSHFARLQVTGYIRHAINAERRHQGEELPDEIEDTMSRDLGDKIASRNFWKDVLNQLPGLERKVIKSHFWENLTFKEIAEKYEVSERTVFYAYERALKKLKELTQDTLTMEVAVQS